MARSSAWEKYAASLDAEGWATVEKYMPTALKMARSYRSATHVDGDLVRDAAINGLIEAVAGFDESKSKLATHIKCIIVWRIRGVFSYKGRRTKSGRESLHEELSGEIARNLAHFDPEREDDELIDRLLKSVPAQAEKIIRDVAIDGYKIHEAGSRVNVSKTRASHVYHEWMKILADHPAALAATEGWRRPIPVEGAA